MPSYAGRWSTAEGTLFSTARWRDRTGVLPGLVHPVDADAAVSEERLLQVRTQSLSQGRNFETWLMSGSCIKVYLANAMKRINDK